MKLIVGLGNPGRKYASTRHNVGSEVIDELARRWGTSKPKVRFQGETVEASIENQKVLLLCPHTFMNRSGQSVQAALDFYKLDKEDLFVIYDDFHLPLARLRFRTQGSAGGHNGLADLIRCLGGDTFPRLRIGIGAPPPEWDVADYVLSRFSKEEIPTIEQAFTRAADSVADWIREGAQYCMNQYNAE